MPTAEAEAVVLRCYPLGEGDRLVTFLSRENGKVKGVARGARLLKSRFGSCLEAASHIRVWYYERETRDLVRINQCELVESFLDVQSDYHKGVALALLCEITDFMLQEREPAHAHFRLVLLAAKSIRQQPDAWLSLAYFTVWTVRLAGWFPSLERCGHCGEKLDSQGAFVAPGLAAFLCSNCRLPGSKVVTPAALDLAKLMLHRKLADVDPKSSESAAARELNAILLDWIELHVDKKLNSRKMLEEGVGQRT
jgi:DNA repair protein RecO (recombination protein O)